MKYQYQQYIVYHKAVEHCYTCNIINVDLGLSGSMKMVAKGSYKVQNVVDSLGHHKVRFATFKMMLLGKMMRQTALKDIYYESN